MSFFSEDSGVAAKSAFALDYADADRRRFVGSQDELGIALNVSRRTVARWMKHPANPGKTANGSYELSKWREFRDALREDDSSADDDSLFGAGMPEGVREKLAKTKLRRETARAEYEELKTAELRRDLISREEILRVFGGAMETLRGILYREFVSKESDPAAFERNKARLADAYNAAFEVIRNDERLAFNEKN